MSEIVYSFLKALQLPDDVFRDKEKYAESPFYVTVDTCDHRASDGEWLDSVTGISRPHSFRHTVITLWEQPKRRLRLYGHPTLEHGDVLRVTCYHRTTVLNERTRKSSFMVVVTGYEKTYRWKNRAQYESIVNNVANRVKEVDVADCARRGAKRGAPTLHITEYHCL